MTCDARAANESSVAIFHHCGGIACFPSPGPLPDLFLFFFSVVRRFGLVFWNGLPDTLPLAVIFWDRKLICCFCWISWLGYVERWLFFGGNGGMGGWGRRRMFVYLVERLFLALK